MAIADKFVPDKENGSMAGPRLLEMAASGAITIAAGEVIITLGSAAALTLDAPPVSMDGARLTITSTTAFAHTVTYTAGFNGAGASKDVATFSTTVGSNFTVKAWAGVWYQEGTPLGVTLA